MARYEKKESWKKPIPKGQYRLIEAILYQYSKMKTTIADWEQSAIDGGAPVRDGMPHGSGISDPSAIAAIKLALPPEHIENSRTWVKVVDAALEDMKKQDEASSSRLVDIAERYYGIRGSKAARDKAVIIHMLAMDYYCSEQTIRNDKDAVVFKVWTYALHMGVIHP